MVKLKSLGVAALSLMTAALGLAALTAPSAGAGPATSAGAATGTFRPAIVSARHVPNFAKNPESSAPTYAQCTQAGLVCYDPSEVRTMYSVGPLIRSGDEGKGQTIVIVDAFGSPTISADLAAFDRAFQLVAPPALHVLHPLGAPTYDESNADEAEWAAETSLDVEWSHAVAPLATIDVLETPTERSLFTNFYRLEDYAYDHQLGKLLTQSWGTAEENLTRSTGGRSLIDRFESLYRKMNRSGWTIFAASGDSGSANVATNGTVYPYPTVSFPASSPQLTSVGGSSVLAESSGAWEGEDVWNDGTDGGAGGGGVSRYFSEPSFQSQITGRSKTLLDGHRGVPDVAWDADPDTGVWVRCTASPSCQSFNKKTDPGYYGWNLAGGTSAGSPQWAGLLADIDQAIGHEIGPIDSDLYRAGSQPGVFHDITSGNNGYDGISGFSARAGWDEGSGWGSPGTALASVLITDGKG